MLFFCRISTRYPAACLAILAVTTLGFAAALPLLELRTDGAALYPRGDRAVEQTAQDRLIFEDPEELILLLSSRPGGPAMTSAAGLRGLTRVHASVAALPGIEADSVRSAASLIDVATSGVGVLGTFLSEVPDDSTELAVLLRRLRVRPSTEGLFLAADGRAAAIYIPLVPGKERREAVAELENWAAGYGDASFDLCFTGPVIAEALLGERILSDLARLVPMMILVVSVLLLVCVRTAGGFVVTVSKMLVVLVWTGGLMALGSVPITLMTTILPVLLLALSVTDEVHVLARLQAKLPSGPVTPGEVRSAVTATIRELYRPVVYTSISTAIGFLSFLSASVVPMRHFGCLAAYGILVAMFMTFTLTPALAVLLPPSFFVRWGSVSRIRWSPAVFAGRHRTLVLVTGLLLLVIGIPGLLRISVQDSWIDNFDPASLLVRTERAFSEAFWGTYRFDVVFAGPPGLFHRPRGAQLVSSAARAAAEASHVGGVVTYLEPLDTVADVLGLAVGAAGLPDDALLAVVEVATTYGRQIGLERLVTPDGHSARILVVVNSPDYLRSLAFARHVEEKLAPLATGSGAVLHTSGDIPLALATVRAVVSNQLRSVAWTFLGIGLLLLLVNRRLWLTVTQLVPPAAAAWLVLSGMGYAGLSLGVATSLFTALTIGVGVDFALHLSYAFEYQRSLGLEAADAVCAALDSTAAGRRWSTVVLSVGFLVLAASAFGPNHHLGLLLAAAMVAAHLTTWLLLPRMLAR